MLAAVRTAFLFGASPTDPDSPAMIPLKSNISSRTHALGYRIDKSTGHFSWTGPSRLTPDDVLSGRQRDSLAEAVEFIRASLSAGPRASDDIIGEARANGFSLPTIQRAKKVLGIKPTAQRTKGKKGVQNWIWALPPDPASCPNPFA